MTQSIHNQFNANLYDLDAMRKLESLGFVDESYGNDSCPKMTFNGNGFHVNIWIEAIDPDMREEDGDPQFQACLYVYGADCAEGMDNKSYWIDGSEYLEATYGLFQCTFPQFKIPRFYNTGETK
tara:strand:- start:2683 stop:3054 length:372 start_codon:yes stop_codon:yes gene_type:complete